MSHIFTLANKNRSAITIKQLNLFHDQYVLDLGCGNGCLLSDMLMTLPDCFAVGVDLSKTMASLVQKNNLNRAPISQIKAVLANWVYLPFSDNSFDRAIASNIIYFWEYADTVLSEVHRVLKPGGKLTIMFQPVEGGNKHEFLRYGYQIFSQKEVKRLLEDNGFQPMTTVIKTERKKNQSWEIIWITSMT